MNGEGALLLARAVGRWVIVCAVMSFAMLDLSISTLLPAPLAIYILHGCIWASCF